MKAKKMLTIITLIVSILSLIIAFTIGKDSNCIFYDISMAFLGSAVLGFIMSITEYYVEKRKAMEEFWSQARSVLRELRKIKNLDVDAPINLILAVFSEERSNEWNQALKILPDDKETCHEAKSNLISWYKENILPEFDENTAVGKELEKLYEFKIEEYKKAFIQCMDSYRTASLIDLGALDNAYGNLDFIFANNCAQKIAYGSIYDRLRNIVFAVKSEVYHFDSLNNGKDNFPVCASKIFHLNQEYFLSKEEESNGDTKILIFQYVFDEIDASLEEFRCKIYGAKYVAPKKEAISGKVVCFGNDEK